MDVRDMHLYKRHGIPYIIMLHYCKYLLMFILLFIIIVQLLQTTM